MAIYASILVGLSVLGGLNRFREWQCIFVSILLRGSEESAPLWWPWETLVTLSLASSSTSSPSSSTSSSSSSTSSSASPSLVPRVKISCGSIAVMYPLNLKVSQQYLQFYKVGPFGDIRAQNDGNQYFYFYFNLQESPCSSVPKEHHMCQYQRNEARIQRTAFTLILVQKNFYFNLYFYLYFYFHLSWKKSQEEMISPFCICSWPLIDCSALLYF